ncbi:MAG: prepilin-type N-terminal cleavage/methylation domain-containing protein [Cyanothece sp. SIO1E1]|nr:prepilin-type N-terminal cleavage/methylation domain-containing protein [Cyanothece sp. SIO1E1]
MNRSKQHRLHFKLHLISQSGFTILESLVAILVVAILLVGISPVITLAVANRIQARRVELATQAAKTYIDGVKAGVITDTTAITADTTAANDELNDVAAPASATLTCDTAGAYCTTPAEAYCVDGDSNGTCTPNSTTDMIVQAVGKIPTDATGTPPNLANGYRSYLLGVRVYRADAFDRSVLLGTGRAQLSSTGGTGLRNDEQPPLVQFTTEIAVEDITEFRALCTAAGITGC